MSGILNTLLTVGLLVGAVIAFQHRCDWFQFCGQDLFAPASAAEAVPVDEVIPEEGTTGGTDETSSNLNSQGNWAGGSSKGCCVCQMQGDRVKCQRHGGQWFNPPAGSGGSNDQSIELSLEECNKGCGSTGTSPTDREKNEVKAVKCAAGYSSVNGKCVKLGANRTKGGGDSGGGGGSRMSPRPATTTRTSSTPQKISPKPGTSTPRYFNANPKGYKPGGGTYYASQTFYAIRPFHAFSGRLSI